MKFSDAFPSKYLKADDLDEENDMIVTIREVEFEAFEDPKTRKSDNKPVIYFKEKNVKPLVLNRTNFKTISDILGGDDSDDWLGQRIALYQTMVESFGERKPGIRVRERKPKPANAPPKPSKPAPKEAEQYDDEVPF